MGREDVAVGKVKQIKGKESSVAGAVTDNTARQIKGNVQQAAGKVEENFGKAKRGK
jgi:uncharacterized protein YjbJ (UPF0337 family)